MTDWANTNYNSLTNEGNVMRYRLDDVLHRLDGPAEMLGNSNYCYWYAGSMHRVDGPAVKWNTAFRNEESWFYHGIKSSKEFVELMESFKNRLNTIEETLRIRENKITVYETFVDTLKNAMDDTHTDEVVVSRKMINAIIEHTK